MTVEQDQEEIGSTVDPEMELNQRRYDEVMALLEGNENVHIKTGRHSILIIPEKSCEREGGCLEIRVERNDPESLLCFDYHVNRNLGLVDFGVDGNLSSVDSGIPGGGSIFVSANTSRDSYDPGDPAALQLDWDKFSNFILLQASTGERTFNCLN